MGSSADSEKIEKLSCPADFIWWRRGIQSFIYRENSKFLRVEDPLTNAFSSEYHEWGVFNMKPKSIIASRLGDTALAKTHAWVGNKDIAATELWFELTMIYTYSSSEAIADLQAKLESVIIDEATNWDKQSSNFYQSSTNFET